MTAEEEVLVGDNTGGMGEDDNADDMMVGPREAGEPVWNCALVPVISTSHISKLGKHDKHASHDKLVLLKAKLP